MPFGGLAGLKEQALKPGKEQMTNAVGDSLGKLQRFVRRVMKRRHYRAFLLHIISISVIVHVFHLQWKLIFEIIFR